MSKQSEREFSQAQARLMFEWIQNIANGKDIYVLWEFAARDLLKRLETIDSDKQAIEPTKGKSE